MAQAARLSMEEADACGRPRRRSRTENARSSGVTGVGLSGKICARLWRSKVPPREIAYLLRRPCRARPAPPATTLSPPATAFCRLPAAPAVWEQPRRRRRARALRYLGPWWAAARTARASAPALVLPASEAQAGRTLRSRPRAALPDRALPPARLPPTRPPTPASPAAGPPAHRAHRRRSIASHAAAIRVRRRQRSRLPCSCSARCSFSPARPRLQRSRRRPRASPAASTWTRKSSNRRTLRPFKAPRSKRGRRRSRRAPTWPQTAGVPTRNWRLPAAPPARSRRE